MKLILPILFLWLLHAVFIARVCLQRRKPSFDLK